jgi:hypothetical protein
MCFAIGRAANITMILIPLKVKRNDSLVAKMIYKQLAAAVNNVNLKDVNTSFVLDI